jgi:hypothetical protein
MFLAGAAADKTVLLREVVMAEDEPGRAGAEQFGLLEQKRLFSYDITSDGIGVLLCRRVFPEFFYVPLVRIRPRQEFRMQIRGFPFSTRHKIPSFYLFLVL